MTNSKLRKRVADKTDLPISMIEEIEKNLWKSVRYYLTHPLEAKKGIMINGFIRFRPLPIARIKQYLKEHGESLDPEQIEFYNNYLKLLSDDKEERDDE
jgi:hypothetical protein